MKKNFFIPFIVLAFLSCKYEHQEEPVQEVEILDNQEIERLKVISDSIFNGIEKNRRGTITRAEFDEYALPLQAEFDSIHETLTVSEKKVIKDYRNEKFDSMVTRLTESP